MNAYAMQFGNISGITHAPLIKPQSPPKREIRKEIKERDDVYEQLKKVPEDWMECASAMLRTLHVMMWEWMDTAIGMADNLNLEHKDECRLLRNIQREFERSQQYVCSPLSYEVQELIKDAMTDGWSKYISRFTDSVYLRLSEAGIDEKLHMYYLSVVQACLGHDIQDKFGIYIDDILAEKWKVPKLKPVPPEDESKPYNIPTAIFALAPEKIWKITNNARKLAEYCILINLKYIHSDLLKENCKSIRK